MKDIAERANVSIGTVSRVLNRHDDVDQDLRERVEGIARKVGYRFSARTQGVIQTRSRIIGLILLNDFGLSSAHSQLLLGVEEYCSRAGYNLLFSRHHFPKDSEVSQIEIPSVVQIPGLADCVILAGCISGNVLHAFEQVGLRYVLLRNHLLEHDGDSLAGKMVQYDDQGGSQEAVRYLAKLGHKHIWYLGDHTDQGHNNRFRGYSQAMMELKLEPHAHTIPLSDDEFESGQTAVSYILEQGWPMTAVLTGSDGLAFGVREGLRLHRLEVPRDVSLIGFEYGVRTRASNVTSVSIDMADVGRHLAKAAILQIEGKDAEAREVIVSTSLIKRSTCRPFRKEEHMVL